MSVSWNVCESACKFASFVTFGCEMTGFDGMTYLPLYQFRAQGGNRVTFSESGHVKSYVNSTTLAIKLYDSTLQTTKM